MKLSLLSIRQSPLARLGLGILLAGSLLVGVAVPAHADDVVTPPPPDTAAPVIDASCAVIIPPSADCVLTVDGQYLTSWV